MADIEKEIKKEEKKVNKFFSKKENVWMTVSIVLAIVLVIGIACVSFGGISKSKASSIIVDFAKSQGVDITVINVSAHGDLYQVVINYQGQDISFYVTKDGKYFGQMSEVKKLTATANPAPTTPAEIPLSDKPNVTLWVFSYCPFGTQAEKGLVPVYNALKSKADINVKFIGAMHGPFEETESLRQLCIQKNYGQDKFMSYIMKLDTNASVGSCAGADACVKSITEGIMNTLSIDPAKINTCMANDAPNMYAAQEAEAKSLGISGSPTIIINGVELPMDSTGKFYQYNDQKIPFSRSANTYGKVICSLFNNAPSQCNQTLDNSAPSTGFGATTSESVSAAQCG